MRKALLASVALMVGGISAEAQLPKHLQGRWEGPASFYGRSTGRLRLTVRGSTVTLTEFQGKGAAVVYEGRATPVRGGWKFEYTGVNVGPSVAGEAGAWYLLDLKLKNGTLGGIASLNEPSRRASEVVRFRLRRP